MSYRNAQRYSGPDTQDDTVCSVLLVYFLEFRWASSRLAGCRQVKSVDQKANTPVEACESVCFGRHLLACALGLGCDQRTKVTTSHNLCLGIQFSKGEVIVQ